jgi:hypothetical protein
MKPETQRSLRQFHRYLGLFFTPAILFFAISGSLQTFRLQEEKGWGSTPPNWIVWLAAIHKDQSPPRAGPANGAVAPGHQAADHEHEADHDEIAPGGATPAPAAHRPSPIPLKIFVVTMAIGLALTSLLGTTIALTNRTTRRAPIGILAAGAVLPCVLLLI